MKLSEYLENQGLSQEGFGRLIGVTQQAVERYVSGARVPRPEVIRRIVDATDGAVEPNDFFEAAA